MGGIARLLIVFGLVSIVIGILLLVAPRIPWVGRLPGDFLIDRGGLKIYVPLATSLVLSIILTVLLNLIGR